MTLTSRNFCVTGATGFIGSRLVKYLINQGAFVTAIVRPSSTYEYLDDVKDKINFCVYDGDVSVLDDVFTQRNFHVTFHLAGACNDCVDDMLRSNIFFGTQLLVAMKNSDFDGVFVNTSTYWQYNEYGEYAPNTLYAASKKAFEDIVMYYVLYHQFKAINLVLYDVYGDGDRRGKLFSLLKNANDDSIIPMTLGEQIVNFIHVDDVVQAYVDVLEYAQINKYLTYFVGHEEYTLRDAVSLFEKIRARSFNLNWGAKEYPFHQIMKPVRGDSIPGWKATITLSDGLKRLAAYEQ